jgi:hypothetical protein
MDREVMDEDDPSSETSGTTQHTSATASQQPLQQSYHHSSQNPFQQPLHESMPSQQRIHPQHPQQPTQHQQQQTRQYPRLDLPRRESAFRHMGISPTATPTGEGSGGFDLGTGTGMGFGTGMGLGGGMSQRYGHPEISPTAIGEVMQQQQGEGARYRELTARMEPRRSVGGFER